MFSNLLLQLIVFFLPTQLGLHFWPDFSRAAGIKVDYLSPTLYFTDILLFLYLSANMTRLTNWSKKHIRSILFYLVFIVLNVLVAISPLNSLFWWLRLSIYFLFFQTLRLNKVTFQHVKKSMFLSTIIVIMIELAQFIGQSSLGGLFYWLGERSFSSSTPGVARLSLLGLDLVRPPSTFSHPNSLAGYLLLVLYLFSQKQSPLWQKLIFLFGLIFTFSKAALLAFLFVALFPSSPLVLVFFLGLSVIQLFIVTLPFLSQSVTDRLFLLSPTKKIIIDHPLGVGLGNFVPSLATYLPGSFLLPAKLQPVHNLFLLFFTELGFPGLASLVYFAKKYSKKLLQPAFLGLLTIVVITGTFDHYWWTLPQNRLILLLAAAILL